MNGGRELSMFHEIGGCQNGYVEMYSEIGSVCGLLEQIGIS